MALTQVSTGGVKDGSLLNADINASAAIAGSKISPDFGSQNIVTTGGLTVDTTTLKVDAANNRGGIGTTSPASFLEIASHNNAETDKFDASNYHLHLRNTENDTGEAIGISFAITSDETAVGAAILHERDAGGSQGSLQFLTNSNGSSVTERMRITSSGKLIVGSTDDYAENVQAAFYGASNGGIALASGTSGLSRLMFADATSGNAGASVGSIIYAHSDNSLRFNVNGGTERMRIDSSGDLFVGCSSHPSSSVTGFSIHNGGGGHHFVRTATNSSNLAYHYQFINTNGAVGQIATSGTSTAYQTSSDYRLKENAVAISDGITRLKTLKPYRFNFKADASTTVDGFFAHEVTAVPEAISGTKDEVDADNNPVYQGIDQSKLVPLLVAAVQELITKVETLEAA